MVADTTTGLVFNLQLDSATTDSSGNGYDMTANNSPTYTTDIDANANSAMDFERSSSQYLSRVDTDDFDFGSATDFAVSFLINRESDAANMTVMTKRDGSVGTNRGWGIWFNFSGDLTDLLVYLRGATAEKYGIFNTNMSTATWYHIVVNCDRDGNAEVFLNGSSVGTTSISGTGDIDNTAAFHIASYNTSGSGSNYFDGVLDNILIYRNRILDADTIAALYAADNRITESTTPSGANSLNIGGNL